MRLSFWQVLAGAAFVDDMGQIFITEIFDCADDPARGPFYPGRRARSRRWCPPVPAACRCRRVPLGRLRCVQGFPASVFVPSRQGTHLPQDSFWVKFIKKRATSTIQVCSSMTTRPPEPIIAPAFFSESKSSGRSRCSLVRQPPEGPPICTALNPAPPRMPAADIENDLAQGSSHRNLDQAGILDIACQGERLGYRGFFPDRCPCTISRPFR